MEQPAELPPLSLQIVFGLAAWACLSVWVVLIMRWYSGKRVLPLARRRQVPWGGLDLLLVFIFFVLSSAAMLFAVEQILGPDAAQPAAAAVEADGAVDAIDAKLETSHAIVQLFRGGNPWTILLCIVSAVVVAPIVEEFLFRVLLQGWLERVDRRLRPNLPDLRRVIPWGVAPIILSSTAFAIVHFRVAAPAINPHYLTFLMIGNSLVGITTMVFAALLLKLKNAATLSDLGVIGNKIPQDTALGLIAAAAVILPIFIIQALLTQILPDWIAPDPIPLFCFAVALGFLYCRTHRVVASVVLHMSLNAISLLALWLFMMG